MKSCKPSENQYSLIHLYLMGQPGFALSGQGSNTPNHTVSLAGASNALANGIAAHVEASIPKQQYDGRLIADVISAASCSEDQMSRSGAGGRASANAALGTRTGCANQYTNFWVFKSANVNNRNGFSNDGSAAAAPDCMSLTICSPASKIQFVQTNKAAATKPWSHERSTS